MQDLYKTYWKDLCGFIHSRFGSGPPDPEDIAQSAFLKFAELPNKDKIQNPKAFIFRMATNLVVDHHRSPKNTLATEEQIKSFEGQAGSDVYQPETVLIGKQSMNVVEQVILSLPERDRAFVLMNRLESMSYTDIAKKANMSRSGVQKIITQALQKCMDALDNGNQASDQ